MKQTKLLLFANVRGENLPVTDRPPQRPEGALIQEAAKRSRKSARVLAANAGISDTRWRHIVNGYQPHGQGVYLAVKAPADTLARMAAAVGVSAEELYNVGRADAAAELAHLPAAGVGSDEERERQQAENLILTSNLPAASKARLLERYQVKRAKAWQQMLDEIRADIRLVEEEQQREIG